MRFILLYRSKGTQYMIHLNHSYVMLIKTLTSGPSGLIRHVVTPPVLREFHPQLNASPLVLFLYACLDGLGTHFPFASEWLFFLPMCTATILSAWEFTTIQESQLPIGMSWR